MRPSNTVIVRGRIAREIALEQTSGGTPPVSSPWP